jgi:hypothetical protein
VLWGTYQIVVRPTGRDTAEFDIAQVRGATFNANVQRFLSPPFSATSLITLSLLPDSDLPAGYVDLNLGLRHPFPGLAQFRGFDVRGIFMADGSSVSQHDPGIVYAQPPAGGGPADQAYMMNPDGYTRWWNATEFIDPMPLLSFKPGKIGMDPNPSATLNPYKYFADELASEGDVAGLSVENRGTFSPSGEINHRNYKIQFPVNGGPQLKFNYAIDASWYQPDPAYKPEYPIESFSGSAQMQEAYNISVSDAGTDAYFASAAGGGDVRLDIEVFDWQALTNPEGVPGEVSAIRLEGYPLMSPVDVLPLAIVEPGVAATSSVFHVDLDASYLSLDKSGEFMLLGSVESADPSTYQPQLVGGESFVYPPDAALASYFMAGVTVSAEAPVLTLISPNGGEKWSVGTDHEITWSSGAGIDTVMLEYSKDDFAADIHTIVASTENDGSYMWEKIPKDVSDTVKVRVSADGNPSVFDISDDYFSIVSATKPPHLIATLTGFHSPFQAKVDTQKDEAWVDCTEAAPVLDFGFYRIDNSENVEKVFQKNGAGFVGMPGWYGLNVEARKIISPDIVGVDGPCNVDVWDLDGGPSLKFGVPLDPTAGSVAFCEDGELFADLSVAVVSDNAPKPNGRLVTWDYNESPPTYVDHPTIEYPTTMEADYEGHRLFVLCAGDLSAPWPTVEVWNAEDWTVITSFLADVGVFPFMTDMDFDPELNRLYFGVGDTQFEAWDVETYTHVQTIANSYGPVAGVDHMGAAIYVTVPGHLLVYDNESFQLLWDIDCGVDPRCLACNPNTKKIYVPDMGNSKVLVYQG